MTTKTHKPCIKELRDITIGAVKYDLTVYVLETEYSCDISANITGSLSAATMLTVLVGSSSAECLSHWPSKPVSRSSFTEYWKLRCAALKNSSSSALTNVSVSCALAFFFLPFLCSLPSLYVFEMRRK